ncbi:LysR family transcriptional regulator [Cupriavidus sp. SK-4]|uniref:LysR family transcriptional regulator n=1 Tax=Cupriavidus sp. SK-4 TaxID=574750 RepID=UPI0004494057|nr:LysR family transcriptional regulator [Cupriavidus sp. SK-4]EYS87871.1 LysR family transcriptional regulator [Cupriavidus sp. SK-4]
MAKSAPMPSAISPTRRRERVPDLHALQTFMAVCESGSMAMAAQRLGVSQSAVSQMIRSLEIEYGIQLFDREVRPARPTRAGNILLEMVDRLLADARHVDEELRKRVRLEHAQIRLGCVDSFAATLGPALIRGLSGSARQMQLWSGLTPGLNAQLLGRELDLAICTEVPVAEARIGQRLLFSESWVAVFPKGSHVLPLSKARDLADRVGDLPLIRYTQRSVIGQQVERYLRHIGVEAARRFEFDATDPLLSLVAAGLGWAVSTPLCLWQSRVWLDQVELVPIPPSRLGQRDFYLLCRMAEWSGLAEDIARITRTVLTRELVPAIRAMLPGLPADAITAGTAESSSVPMP